MRGYGKILGLIFILIVILALMGQEMFTSTGTITQLQSSHVPSVEELKRRECTGGLYGCVYREIPLGF